MKLQLDKSAAETRVAATEKARLAEQERARLAAEGAQKSQQAKAEADAKAAEQARIAAEKAKQVAQEQAAAGEQKRITAEKAAAEKDKPVNVAALNTGTPPQADVTQSVQAELRRVGCLTGAAHGNWNAASQRSLTQFNRHTGTKLDAKVASVEALDAIKQKISRVCPLICEHGFKAEGKRCTKITCAAGSFLNDDNECEKRRANKPAAKRDRPEARQVPEAKQVIVRRSQTPTGAGLLSTGRPLTGAQREYCCYSGEAIVPRLKPSSMGRWSQPANAAAMEMLQSLLSSLLNTEVVYLMARFQLRRQPARLLATTGPGL